MNRQYPTQRRPVRRPPLVHQGGLLVLALLAATALWPPTRADAAPAVGPHAPSARSAAAAPDRRSARDALCPADAGPWSPTPTRATPWGLSSGTDDSYSAPALAANRDGRLEAFALEDDGSIQHASQNTPNGSWSSWSELGGSSVSGPSVTRNKDGRLEVFAVGTDCALWHTWQTSPGGPWQSWKSLGSGASPLLYVTAAIDSNGRLHAFALGVDDHLYEIAQLRAGGATRVRPDRAWSEWTDHGGGIDSRRGFSAVPAVVLDAAGHLEVFEVDLDQHLELNEQRGGSGGWSGWKMGQWADKKVLGDPVAAVDRNHRVEVFVESSSETLAYAVQPQKGTSLWPPLSDLGGLLVADPAVTVNKDGRLEVFAPSNDGAIHHIWQSAPGSPTWKSWDTLGGLVSGPMAALGGKDGSLYVVDMDPAGYPLLDRQDSPNGHWSGWNALPPA